MMSCRYSRRCCSLPRGSTAPPKRPNCTPHFPSSDRSPWPSVSNAVTAPATSPPPPYSRGNRRLVSPSSASRRIQRMTSSRYSSRSRFQTGVNSSSQSPARTRSLTSRRSPSKKWRRASASGAVRAVGVAVAVSVIGLSRHSRYPFWAPGTRRGGGPTRRRAALRFAMLSAGCCCRSCGDPVQPQVPPDRDRYLPAPRSRRAASLPPSAPSAQQQPQHRLRPPRVRLLAGDEVEIGVGLDQPHDHVCDLAQVDGEVEPAGARLLQQQLVDRVDQTRLEVGVVPREQAHRELTLLGQPAPHAGVRDHVLEEARDHPDDPFGPL